MAFLIGGSETQFVLKLVANRQNKERDKTVECVNTIPSYGFETFEAADEKWLA
jgi:hypothetical protein